MTTTAATLAAALAAAFAAAFTSKTRGGDTGESYAALRDGSPGWMTDACRAAHDDGDLLPDDWRYRRIWEAADRMSEMTDEEISEGPRDGFGVDDANSGLTSWLASNLRRMGYCDEAVSEYGIDTNGADVATLIRWGQDYEARLLWGQLAAFLTEEAQRQTAAADAVPA